MIRVFSVGSIGRGQGCEGRQSRFFGWLEKKNTNAETEYNKQHYEDALCFSEQKGELVFLFFCFSVCVLVRIDEQRARREKREDGQNTQRTTKKES